MLITRASLTASPALQTALLECATPSVSADSVRLVLAALLQSPATIDWHDRLPLSCLMHGLPDTVTLDALCLQHWGAIETFLLSHATASPSLAALTILCANHGAPVPIETLEDSLDTLRRRSSESLPLLTPSTIARLREPFLTRFLLVGGTLIVKQWDTTDADILSAWLLHPTIQAHPALCSNPFINTCELSLFWKIWSRLQDRPDAMDSYQAILNLCPPVWRLALLACPTLSLTTTTELLTQLGRTTFPCLAGLPAVTIPETVWTALSADERLQALTHFYRQESKDHLLPELLVPQSQLDLDVMDLSIRGESSALIEDFLSAQARRVAFHAHDVDLACWLADRFDARFSPDHTPDAILHFFRQLIVWLDEYPAARRPLIDELLQCYREWTEFGTRALDHTPHYRLTRELIQLRPPFLRS